MSNMQYCRMQNTLEDLKDCRAAILRVLNLEETLSTDELKAAISLVQTCGRILEDINIDGESADMMCELVSGTDEGHNWVESMLTDMNGEAKRQLERQSEEFGQGVI